MVGLIMVEYGWYENTHRRLIIIIIHTHLLTTRTADQAITEWRERERVRARA